MRKRLILKISGLVQGVGFRFFSSKKAKKLNLSGWVRNEPDGAVLLVAEGEEENLKKIIDLCYTGSIFSRVDEIKISWEEARGDLRGFEIKFS